MRTQTLRGWGRETPGAAWRGGDLRSTWSVRLVGKTWPTRLLAGLVGAVVCALLAAYGTGDPDA